MSLSNADQLRLREIVKATVHGDRPWLEAHDIDVRAKGPYYILNYGMTGKNDHNRLVRGLVIDPAKTATDPLFHRTDPLELIVSFPFTRFFNRGEPQAAAVDLTTADMIEKMDGTMVGVFFPTGTEKVPSWHTRKMVSASPEDMGLTITTFHGKNYNFLEEIGKYVKAIQWPEWAGDFTWVFEFIHEASFVWTKYQPEQYGLYLLGARDRTWHVEADEETLDSYAEALGVRRPRRWSAVKDEDAILAKMQEVCAETPGFEGFVFRDKAGNRVKMKDSDYVKFHHMLDKLSFKNLLPKVLEGETEEILAYFPSAKPRVELIQQRWAETLERVTGRVLYWLDQNLDRKSMACRVFGQGCVAEEPDRWTAGQVMRLASAKTPRESVRPAVEAELKKLVIGPKRLLEVLGITDVEEEDANPAEA